MDADKIVKIIEAVNASGLTDVSIESQEVSIKLSRAVHAAAAAAPVMAVPMAATIQPMPVQHVQVHAAEESAAAHDPSLKLVTSPIVGTFYASPKPESPAFVSVGSKVKKGDGLCIIEAMKLMNEIDAEFDCEIVEICAKNEQMVEFGQTLFKVRPL